MSQSHFTFSQRTLKHFKTHKYVPKRNTFVRMTEQRPKICKKGETEITTDEAEIEQIVREYYK